MIESYNDPKVVLFLQFYDADLCRSINRHFANIQLHNITILEAKIIGLYFLFTIITFLYHNYIAICQILSEHMDLVTLSRVIKSMNI